MSKMPKPLAVTRETVTISRGDWNRIVDRLDDAANRVALRVSAMRTAADKDDALPVALYRRIRKGEHPLRVWREHRGVGPNALARAAGVSAPYLSEIEKGIKPGSAAILNKLAKALEIGLDELV